MDIFSLIPLTASMLFVLIPLLLVLIAFMILSNHFMEHIAEQHANRFFSSKLFQRLHGAGRKRRGAETARLSRTTPLRFRLKTEQIRINSGSPGCRIRASIFAGGPAE